MNKSKVVKMSHLKDMKNAQAETDKKLDCTKSTERGSTMDTRIFESKRSLTKDNKISESHKQFDNTTLDARLLIDMKKQLTKEVFLSIMREYFVTKSHHDATTKSIIKNSNRHCIPFL